MSADAFRAWSIAVAMSAISCCFSSAAVLPAGFAEDTIGGTWNEAAGLTFASDGRLFVWERGGRVWTVDNGVKNSVPFLDISEEVGSWRDFGLLGFALHPDFESNGYVYAFYVVDRHHLKHFGTPAYSSSTNEYNNATIGRITRYTARASDARHTVDPASRKILLGETANSGVPILHESHGTGTILFGTDGTLLVSCGDGASYSTTDIGSASESYYQTALNDGIIRNKENIGAYRAQLVDSLNGKILRLNAETGNGVPGNPFYDSANPRSARSRVWALGLRNPFRMGLRPNSGSHNPADARPGVLYIGDVGWYVWEELNVCDRPGQNFGWPAFEGLTEQPAYLDANVPNLDAANPLFGTAGCSQQYFYFGDLIKQDSLRAPSWANPCNASEQIPSSIPRFVHRRPAIDWMHGQADARTGIYSQSNAAVIAIGATGSPVSGTQFSGNSSTGGSWYTNTSFPPQFRNTWFHGDYVGKWIKSFVFDTNNQPTAVQNFATNAGGVVAIAIEPATGDLYYVAWTSELRRIRYTAAGNRPPTAVISANRIYGAAPLVVQFSSAGSTDPDNQLLTYRWTFGDGTAASTNANPNHTFNAPVGTPTPYTVMLVVTDPIGASATNRLLISVNNTPPQISITSPTNGTRYPLSGSITYACTATVTDAEHTGAQLRCAWQTILHHNEHEHPEPAVTNCSTTTVISPIGCNGETYYYRVVLTVTDSAGLTSSNQVLLYPQCAPVITSTPQNQAVFAGDNVMLSVTSEGAMPLRYQWRKNLANISGATNRSLAINNVQKSAAGNYTVVVSNAFGMITSAPPAIISVLEGPALSHRFIAAGSAWKYLDDGSNQGTIWRRLSFNDSTWPLGLAEFGYGDGDEATVVNSGPNSTNRYITTYFRRRFSVTNAASYTDVTIRFVRDDGVVIYLNGLELLRNNMTTGTITYTTPALTGIGGTNESVWVQNAIDPALLREGTNLLAVEMHQSGPASPDLSFDLELVGRFDMPQPFLRSAVAPGGRFRLWFSAVAGTNYVIEASSNLNQWAPVSTNSSLAGTVNYTNVMSGRRFFRVRTSQ